MWCANTQHQPLYMSEESVLIARFEDGSFPLIIEVYNMYHCRNCGATVMQPSESMSIVRKFDYGQLNSEEARNWINKTDFFIDRDEYDKAILMEINKVEGNDEIPF